MPTTVSINNIINCGLFIIVIIGFWLKEALEEMYDTNEAITAQARNSDSELDAISQKNIDYIKSLEDVGTEKQMV